MSDRDTLVAMLDRAGIRYAENNEGGEFAQGFVERITYASILGVGEDKYDAPRNLGYHGFFTNFYFDADGNLLCMAAWE